MTFQTYSNVSGASSQLSCSLQIRNPGALTHLTHLTSTPLKQLLLPQLTDIFFNFSAPTFTGTPSFERPTSSVYPNSLQLPRLLPSRLLWSYYWEQSQELWLRSLRSQFRLSRRGNNWTRVKMEKAFWRRLGRLLGMME
jgi:hypothetical protein